MRSHDPSAVDISLRQVMTHGPEASQVKRRPISAPSMDSNTRRSPSMCPLYNIGVVVVVGHHGPVLAVLG
jgi:hypothetical protein